MWREATPISDDAQVDQAKTSKPSPKTGEGAVCVRWVRCGKLNCRCRQGGPKHGPYFAQYWREGGRRQKRYVRKLDAAEVAAACSKRQAAEQAQRAQEEAARQTWRDLRAVIREVEHGRH
ncbi:MAG: DUF6788 family protein [Vicinamibacterales bacterium]